MPYPALDRKQSSRLLKSQKADLQGDDRGKSSITAVIQFETKNLL